MKTKSFASRLAVFMYAMAISIGFASQLQAQARNIEKSGRALQGYDPVAFFTDGKPVKGEPTIHSSVNGAKYYFSTAENKTMFDKDPGKYEPEFGGYCAYGVTKGDLIKIDVNAFQIVNGRLLLQYSKGVREKFNKDTQGNLKIADAKWPEVSKK
ncbi:MAG: YHS domain protein [Armatimonadetes bacterium]|nr:YHS domain protein [Akkermansiaceae bacterium]